VDDEVAHRCGQTVAIFSKDKLEHFVLPSDVPQDTVTINKIGEFTITTTTRTTVERGATATVDGADGVRTVKGKDRGDVTENHDQKECAPFMSEGEKVDVGRAVLRNFLNDSGCTTPMVMPMYTDFFAGSTKDTVTVPVMTADGKTVSVKVCRTSKGTDTVHEEDEVEEKISKDQYMMVNRLARAVKVLTRTVEERDIVELLMLDRDGLVALHKRVVPGMARSRLSKVELLRSIIETVRDPKN